MYSCGIGIIWKSREKIIIDLIRDIKILAAEKDARVNDLLEEAIQDLLKKYEKKRQ
jgi:hypothetical protein